MHVGYGFECAGLKTQAKWAALRLLDLCNRIRRQMYCVGILKTLYCTDSAYTFSLRYKKIKASETMQSLAIPKYHFSLDGFSLTFLQNLAIIK